MYTLHYYAGSHKADLRSKAQTAINNGLPIFVTEYGTVNADGNGGVDTASSNEWWSFLNKNSISHANWAVEDKNEGAAVFVPGTPGTLAAVGSDSNLTPSGKLPPPSKLTHYTKASSEQAQSRVHPQKLKHDNGVKLEEEFKSEMDESDYYLSTSMFDPLNTSASMVADAESSPQTSTSEKKPKTKTAEELKADKTEPTGLVHFRQGTAAVGYDVYVCSKRKTTRCQARVNMSQSKSMGEFTHREHNHCSPYFRLFNPNSKANPKLRPGAFKTRSEPRKPVIRGDWKPEWDEPPGVVHFKCRQSAQKSWNGNASRMLISPKGYEYRRRKVLANGISELEIRNDENFGVFVITQHNHPPKYPDNNDNVNV
uniref:Glycoside hydrolase family 5 domain-containing protein n=1 Tax=Ditylenchus dipsaci TaxID=166011 RepID=A0A915EFR0_9BILA